MQVGQLDRFFYANPTFPANLFRQNLTINVNWLTVYAWERGSIVKLAFYKSALFSEKSIFSCDAKF